MFVTYGRNKGNLELTVSHMGRTSRNDLENYFTTNKFENFTAYTDRHKSYISFFKKHNINYKTFISKNHVCKSNKDVHNQTANAYTNQFKLFVNSSLHGVSTKFIGFYAKWYEFMVNIKKEIKKIIEDTKQTVRFDLTDKICNNILDDFNGLEFYRQSEYSFLQFLKVNKRTNFGNCKNHYYS